MPNVMNYFDNTSSSDNTSDGDTGGYSNEGGVGDGNSNSAAGEVRGDAYDSDDKERDSRRSTVKKSAVAEEEEAAREHATAPNQVDHRCEDSACH